MVPIDLRSDMQRATTEAVENDPSHCLVSVDAPPSHIADVQDRPGRLSGPPRDDQSTTAIMAARSLMLSIFGHREPLNIPR